MQVIDVVPVLDTNAYADNDVMFVAIAVTGFITASRPAGSARKLVSVVAIDQADQAQDFDLVFTEGTVTIGTINDAVNLVDADALKVVGGVSIVAADYIDTVNNQVAVKRDINLVMQPSAALFVSGIIRSGTPTYAASSIKLRLGFED